MRRLSLSLSLSLILAFGACTATDDSMSGLLGSYSGFKRRPDGTLVQTVADEQALQAYRRIMLEDVLIYLDPEAQGSVRPSDQRRLVQLFRAALLKEIGTHYELVGDLAALESDVMRIRPAITDVQPGVAEGEGARLGNATVEIEATDSNGERLAAVVSRKSAEHVGVTPQERLAEAERLFQEWAESVRIWLDEVTGR